MKKFLLFTIIFSCLQLGCATRKIIVENCDETISGSNWVCEQRIWAW